MPIIVFSIAEHGRDRSGAARQGPRDRGRLGRRRDFGIEMQRRSCLGGALMATTTHDINELKRRMQGASAVLKHGIGRPAHRARLRPSARSGQVEAYGAQMPLNQLATVSVPEPRLLTVQVWDRSMVHAVEKAIVDANLGLSPATEGQVLRLRIPELNEERRKELVKVAHKYAETARVAVRHVRRDGIDADQEAGEGSQDQRGRPRALGRRGPEGDRSGDRRDRSVCWRPRKRRS